ncbi:MAG: hypothetical protein JKY52_09880 [Flavobacteriales bacterium]|nr:hypothetical protein [Flavobacteriales bacterium]
MTSSDLDKVLVDINRVFALLEDRIEKLEKAPKHECSDKTTTKKVTAKRVTNKA